MGRNLYELTVQDLKENDDTSWINITKYDIYIQCISKSEVIFHWFLLSLSAYFIPEFIPEFISVTFRFAYIFPLFLWFVWMCAKSFCFYCLFALLFKSVIYGYYLWIKLHSMNPIFLVILQKELNISMSETK